MVALEMTLRSPQTLNPRAHSVLPHLLHPCQDPHPSAQAPSLTPTPQANVPDNPVLCLPGHTTPTHSPLTRGGLNVELAPHRCQARIYPRPVGRAPCAIAPQQHSKRHLVRFQKIGCAWQTAGRAGRRGEARSCSSWTVGQNGKWQYHGRGRRRKGRDCFRRSNQAWFAPT